MRVSPLLTVLFTLLLPAALLAQPAPECDPWDPADPLRALDAIRSAGEFRPLNTEAGRSILYEIQVRSANACNPDVGSEAQRKACREKLAPKVTYRAENMKCDEATLAELEKIKLGTLEDLVADTAEYEKGITVRYVREKVGANTLWLMPLFPNNDTWNIPHPCDNLGSPYAVRDYLHVSGTLSESCIEKGADERSAEPCWGDDSLDKVIAEAHGRGMKVILDVAFNHFGHNYQLYDYVDVGENQGSSDFDATFDPALLKPEILDRPAKLDALARRDRKARGDLALLDAKCPGLAGDKRVRMFNAWRVALDWERASFSCAGDAYLEQTNPGFYLGRDRWNPATGMGDNFTNEWRDVKFLYHHGKNEARKAEFERQREYLFRVMNYWTSRGVDGFRLDHTTDPDGGMGPDEWRYLTDKVSYYAAKRGQKTPVFMAEEFSDHAGMNKVVDAMTEGWVFDLNGRNGRTKDAAYVERVVRNRDRFGGATYTMTALETHDEHRLTDGTGFDAWTGAGFWGVGASTWSMPMILMGQEQGEPFGVGFRRSDFLRSRFEGTANRHPEGAQLAEFYRAMNTARLDPKNRALISAPYHFLRTRDGNAVDPRIFAQVKWEGSGAEPRPARSALTGTESVVFTFNNLWKRPVAQSYTIPQDLAQRIGLEDEKSYRLVDTLAERPVGDCRSGREIRTGLHVEMDAETRLQWLRLEPCR